jgi:hypothetical protein
MTEEELIFLIWPELEKYKKDNMIIIENIIGKENMKDATPSLIAEKVGIFLERRNKK